MESHQPRRGHRGNPRQCRKNSTRHGTVTHLLRAALTNAPNLELTALASARGTMDTCDPTGLRQLLELPDGADIDAITEAVKKPLTAAQSAVDPAHDVPIGDFKRIVSDYNRIHQGLSLQAAEQAVERAVACGVLPPSLRDWGIIVCSVNKPVSMTSSKPPGLPSIEYSSDQVLMVRFAMAPPDYNKVAMIVPSGVREEVYAWLGTFPRLREWLGDRVIQSLTTHGQPIRNRRFESTFELSLDDIKDDQAP